MTLVDRSLRRQFTAAMALAMALALLLGGTALAQTTSAAAAVVIDDSCNDVPDAGFPDVSGQFEDEINCFAAYGFTAGKADGTYDPSGTVRRWQMALFIYRLAVAADGQLAAVDLPGASDQGFTDISDVDAEAQDAINVLAEIGVVEGKTATTFVPFENIRRDQMASFINRLQGYIQEQLGGDASGFAQANAVFPDVPASNVHKDNIDALYGVGIVEGFGDGTYGPRKPVTRQQMSLFIMRHFEVNVNNGVLTSAFPPEGQGVGGVITAVGVDSYTFTTDDGDEVTVNYDSDDTFSIDGAEATEAAFEADIAVGDRISFVDDDSADDADEHHLINAEASNDGTIGNVNIGTTSLDIIEPVSGTSLVTHDYTDVTAPVTANQYEVDGVAVGQADFEKALNEGDTVEIETSDTGVRTFMLTNVTATGVVTDTTNDADGNLTADDPGFQIGALGDDEADGQDDYFEPGAADTYLVDGVASDQAGFLADVTNGDQATYKRENGTTTITLVNEAPSDVTGEVQEGFATGAAGGSADLIDDSGEETVAYTAAAQFLVDGVVSTEAEFEAELSEGDAVVYTPEDPGTTGTEERISLTNQSLSGVVADVDTAGNMLDVLGPDDTTPSVDDLTYSVAYFGGAARYYIDGTEVSLADFEDALDDDIDADSTIEIVDVNDADDDDVETQYRLMP